jgi:hypothetical protein
MRLARGAKIRKTAALCGLLGLALACAVSTQIQDRYVSEAVLQQSQPGQERALAQTIEGLLNRQLLQHLIEKHNLYSAERCCVPLEDLLETMKQNIAVEIHNENGQPQRRITLSFKYPDAAVAQKVTLYLTMALLENQQAGTVTLLSSPTDGVAFFPNRLNIAIAGMLGGAILGAIWALAMGRKAKLAS